MMRLFYLPGADWEVLQMMLDGGLLNVPDVCQNTACPKYGQSVLCWKMNHTKGREGSPEKVPRNCLMRVCGTCKKGISVKKIPFLARVN